MPTTCAIYIRVSTNKQEDNYSLKQQREDLPRLAESRGWVYTLYDEGAVSAETVEARPQFQRLLEDVSSGKTEVLLVKELSRIIRSESRQERGRVLDLLATHNVTLATPEATYNPTNEDHALMLDIQFSFSSAEKRKIVRRMSGGTLKAAKEGRYLGSRFSPYGYIYDKTYYDPKQRMLKGVPKEAEVVRLIYKMYLEGHGSSHIANYLDSQGFKPRVREQNVRDPQTGVRILKVVSADRFTSKFVCDVLKNPVYVGKLIWNKCHYDERIKNRHGGKKYVRNPQTEWIEARGQHESIIEQDTFDRVQVILRQRRDKHGVPRRAIPSIYILTPVLKCGRCQGGMRGGLAISNRRLQLKKRWYFCSAYKTNTESCRGDTVAVDLIESEVIAKVRELCQSNLILKQVEQDVMAQLTKQGHPHDAEYVIYRTQLDDVLTRQQKLLDERLSGSVGGEQFKRMNQTLLDEETRLRAKVKQLERQAVEQESRQYNSGAIIAILRNFDRLFSSLIPIRQKMVIQAIFQRIILKDRHVDWEQTEFNPPFDSLVSAVSKEVMTK